MTAASPFSLLAFHSSFPNSDLRRLISIKKTYIISYMKVFNRIFFLFLLKCTHKKNKGLPSLELVYFPHSVSCHSCPRDPPYLQPYQTSSSLMNVPLSLLRLSLLTRVPHSSSVHLPTQVRFLILSVLIPRAGIRCPSFPVSCQSDIFFIAYLLVTSIKPFISVSLTPSVALDT